MASWIYAYLLLILGSRLELHATIHECKQGVVPAHADVIAGFHTRATLSDDNVPCAYELSTVAFHSQSLRITVATAPCAAAAFLMCHILLSRHDHTVNCQSCLLRSEACLPALPCLILVSEDDYFLSLHRPVGCGQNFRAIHSRGTYLTGFTIGYEKHSIQLYCFSINCCQVVDIKNLARSNLILFSTGFNYGVNFCTSKKTLNFSISANAASS